MGDRDSEFLIRKFGDASCMKGQLPETLEILYEKHPNNGELKNLVTLYCNKSISDDELMNLSRRIFQLVKQNPSDVSFEDLLDAIAYNPDISTNLYQLYRLRLGKKDGDLSCNVQ